MSTDWAADWPGGNPRILITDSWLANAGDAAASLGLESIVRRIAPRAAILHASYQGGELGHLLPDLHVVGALEELLGTPWAPPAPHWAATGWDLVGAADLIICQSGGALAEGYRPDARIAALSDVAGRGLPMAVFGATIEPFFRSAPRRDLGRILRHAALVSVRDRRSLSVARELGASDPMIGSDPALDLFDDPPAELDRSGISLVLSGHHSDKARQPAVRRAAAMVEEVVCELAGTEPITMWSTVQGLPQLAGEDDSQIVSGAPHRPGLARAGYIGPLESIDRVRSSRIVVTMRMHPALFAAGTGTPFALVLDGQRTGTFEGSGLVDRLASPWDRGDVERVVKAALADPGRPGDIWEALGPLRRRLADSADRLGDLICSL